jgi:hypothetical protein
MGFEKGVQVTQSAGNRTAVLPNLDPFLQLSARA